MTFVLRCQSLYNLCMGQSLPLHIKINELLTRELAAGHWRAGERLPTEPELASQLGCAVGTLRKALAELESQGLIERRHGSGTYVKQAPVGKSVYEFFRLALRNGEGVPTALILSFQAIDHPSDVPPFGNREPRQCYRVRRLRSLNNTPIALEEIYFDTHHNRTLTVNDLGEALYLFYQTQLGFWIANAQDSVSIASVPAWTNPLFALPAGAACGYIERHSFASTDALEEFSRTWFNPKVAHYTSRIR
jgi:DNA-binding GntR family transcriptional regulator